MKKLVEVPLNGSAPIVVEVDEPEGTKGFRTATSKEGIPERITQTFEESLQTLRPALDRIRQTLDEINNPSEVELQFGIKIVGGVGAVFSSVSTEANFAVKLTWKNESKQQETNPASSA